LRALILFLLFLLPALVHAQVTTSKPSCGSYTIDVGETHYPDHLWVICEGTGTTTADEGSGTARTLTFGATTGSGPDWVTDDATHGTVLDFVTANKDFMENTSLTTPTGIQTICVVMKVGTTAATSDLIQLSDNSANNALRLFVASDGDMGGQARDTSGNTVNQSVVALDDGAWNMLCGRVSDVDIDISKNGAAYDQTGHARAILTNIDQFVAGANRLGAVNSGHYDGLMAAIWWYDSDKSDANIATIYNSGNPWPIIGVDSDSWIRRRR